MFESVATAEGAGWGAKGSTSAGVLKRSQVSENTVTYTIGSAQTAFRKTVRNPNKMTITKAAKDLLVSDP